MCTSWIIWGVGAFVRVFGVTGTTTLMVILELEVKVCKVQVLLHLDQKVRKSMYLD